MALSALSAGLSGMVANQQALDVQAHNIANVNTAGFQPQQASFQEASPAGTGVTLSAAGRGLSAASASSASSASSAPSGTDLAGSTVNSMLYQAGFQLSAKVVQAADQRMGTIIDIQA